MSQCMMQAGQHLRFKKKSVSNLLPYLDSSWKMHSNENKPIIEQVVFKIALISLWIFWNYLEIPISEYQVGLLRL